jgi:hypothetical protein
MEGRRFLFALPIALGGVLGALAALVPALGQGQGPIPVGGYTIGDPVDGPPLGPVRMRLDPDAGNDMFGRSGFLIHADNSDHDYTASEGCIILPRSVRDRIVNSGDDRLHVVP